MGVAEEGDARAHRRALRQAEIGIGDKLAG
jgi:hypothetical protein